MHLAGHTSKLLPGMLIVLSSFAFRANYKVSR